MTSIRSLLAEETAGRSSRYSRPATGAVCAPAPHSTEVSTNASKALIARESTVIASRPCGACHSSASSLSLGCSPRLLAPTWPARIRTSALRRRPPCESASMRHPRRSRFLAHVRSARRCFASSRARPPASGRCSSMSSAKSGTPACRARCGFPAPGSASRSTTICRRALRARSRKEPVETAPGRWCSSARTRAAGFPTMRRCAPCDLATPACAGIAAESTPGGAAAARSSSRSSSGASSALLLVLALALDERVHGREEPVAGADGVVAVHAHGRRAVDLVVHGELLRPTRLALHAERLHRVVEFLRVDAILLQPLGERFLVGALQVVFEDGVEERLVHLRQHA